MKNSKLFISVISVLLLVFVAASSVFAVSGDKGTITITNAQVGKTYEIYKILDLTYVEIEGKKNVAYTIADEWEKFFFSDSEGTRSDEGGKYLLTEAEAKAAGLEKNLNRITVEKRDGTFVQYYLNINDTNVAQFSQDALGFITNVSPKDVKEKVTSTTVTFEKVELGYYLVYPRGATQIMEGKASLASLTSTLPSVNVNVKSTYLNIEKEDYEDAALQKPEDGNVYVGQKVYYEVTSTVPDTTGYTGVYTYKIYDKLSAGLSKLSDLVIKFGDTEIKPSEKELILQDTSYSLNFDMTKYQEYKGQKVTITYNAIVTEEAVNSVNALNHLKFKYSNNPKDSTVFEEMEEKEYVYSSKVIVNKVLEDNKTPLAGAEFVLYKKEGNKKLYYKATDATGNVITSTPSVSISTTKGVTKVEWVEKEAEATHLTTDDKGLATFNGLLNGTYFLKETQVPDGYNRLVNDKEVKVEFKGFTETNDSGKHDGTLNPGEFPAVIVNITGTELPETGGMGTTIFVTVGTTLALVAGIVLVTNRRMAKERF